LELRDVTGIDAIGYLAASLVLATFCMRSMSGLRFVAITSNLAFIAYGYYGDLMPVLFLHVLLLPVNILRLTELASNKCKAVPERIGARTRWQGSDVSTGSSRRS
jgi:hypothetical protein